MQKILLGVGVLLIIFGIFGASYTWHHDHREAQTLDKYAATEFQVARDGDGNMGLTLPQERTDGIKVGLGIEDLRHSGHLLSDL